MDEEQKINNSTDIDNNQCKSTDQSETLQGDEDDDNELTELENICNLNQNDKDSEDDEYKDAEQKLANKAKNLINK